MSDKNTVKKAMAHLRSRVDFFGVGNTEERAIVEEFDRMRKTIERQNETITAMHARAVYAEELIMTRGLQPEQPPATDAPETP